MLAPRGAAISPTFRNVTYDDAQYDRLLHAMQRMRGAIYVGDGAVPAEHLAADGCHRTPEDERGWHLLWKDDAGHVAACAWYMEHAGTPSVGRLRVGQCPLEGEWRDRLWAAVEFSLEQAAAAGLKFAELGGLAIDTSLRNTPAVVIIVLAAYALSRSLGGALAMTTATVRHSSSTILRRLGGGPLEVAGEPLPPYYDARYRCAMELLRFDSREPAGRYVRHVDDLGDRLAHVPVLATCGLA